MPERASPPRPPAPPVDDVLRLLIQGRWRTFARQLARVQQRPNAAAVHDIRVAARRLLATINIADAVGVTKTGRRARKAVRTLLKTLNALRDVQVQRGTVRRLVRRHRVLRSYGADLRRRESALLREARAAFRGFPLPRVEQDLGALEAEVDRFFDRPSARNAGAEMLRGSVAAGYGRVMALRRAIRYDRPASLHRFRVAFKKFRYSIELLDAVFPWVTRRLRKEMNHYQTALGELQDLEVLSAGLRTFARRRRPVRPASLASFLPVYGALDRRREELLAEFRRSVDAIDRFWGAAGDRE